MPHAIRSQFRWAHRPWRRPLRIGCALAGFALAVIALAAPAGIAVAGELGAFFTPGAQSAYERGPRQGGRLALAAHTAYAVVGLAWEGGDRLWLRLSVPERVQLLRGEGWTPLTAQELAARSMGLVEVYSHPLEPGAVPATALQMAGSEVQVLGGARASSRPLAPLVWRRVRYATRRPAQVWVPAAQGIYRPGRSPAFLAGAYQEMSARQVPAESLARLLAGIVRKGDSAQDVRWAWGEPQRTRSEGEEGHRVAVWEYAEGQIRFDGAGVREVK
jgi:hypothetical protein